METIDDEDELFRRLLGFHINPDGTVNSAAYKLRGKPDPSVSVDLARLTTPKETVSRGGLEGVGLGQISASVPRRPELGFNVFHAPEPDNNAHSLVEGENSKAKCRLLAEATVLILRPAARE